MSNPMAKVVWDTYEKWEAAQGHLHLYQRVTQEVEAQLKGFTEEQRTLFTQLQALGKPPEKPKDGSPVVAQP